ncbi:MFS transporter [Paraburkholderia sp. CNPSo 3281]|uniref:MFS transporter n=1 Tax=Paraburkholderia sp. CNPSo 3281 TaxID=2940933 RepID=UPI0020B69485|nr:MFS transporter [Paraburkholderia sp. CNPSo 3281]MCP3716717.1 MFS transporter [Paraburkholderia sp. CNPSo 3281]
MNAQACEEAYRRRDLPVCLGVRFLSEASTLTLSVVVGWTVYKVSQTPLTLGIVGIVEFIPATLMTLPVGELCDRLSPCPLVVAGLALQGFCALAFFALSTLHMKGLGFFYGVALLLGTARAVAEPAAQALLPLLVPPDRLPRAVACSSTAWQMAIVLGPVVGGLCYAMGSSVADPVCAVATGRARCAFSRSLRRAAWRCDGPVAGLRPGHSQGGPQAPSSPAWPPRGLDRFRPWRLAESERLFANNARPNGRVKASFLCVNRADSTRNSSY